MLWAGRGWYWRGLRLVSAIKLIIVMIVTQVNVIIRTLSRILMILIWDCSFTVSVVLLPVFIHDCVISTVLSEECRLISSLLQNFLTASVKLSIFEPSVPNPVVSSVLKWYENWHSYSSVDEDVELCHGASGSWCSTWFIFTIKQSKLQKTWNFILNWHSNVRT